MFAEKGDELKFEAQILDAREHATAALKLAEDLERQLKLARGTEEIPRELSLNERIEQALRRKPMALDELARVVDEAGARVQNTIKGMRVAGRVHNVGTQDRPRWFWAVGEEAPPKDVQAAVLILIQEQPMTHAELKLATRTTDGKLQGAIIEIRRTHSVLDLGTPSKKRYFVVGEGARDAKLLPKRKKEYRPKE